MALCNAHIEGPPGIGRRKGREAVPSGMAAVMAHNFGSILPNWSMVSPKVSEKVRAEGLFIAPVAQSKGPTP